MNPTVISYAVYLTLAIPLTVWVARTLHRNGRIFLVHCFQGDEEMATSVNHLLVVGFYLVNFGFVSLWMKSDELLRDSRAIFEGVSAKIGVVLLVLGAMHFLNIWVFNRFRERARRQLAPPVPPVAQF